MQGSSIDPDDNNSFNEGYKSREIRSSKYEHHLSANQQQDLVQILQKFPNFLVAF
jgi:hypothetical protein